MTHILNIHQIYIYIICTTHMTCMHVHVIDETNKK